MDGPDLHVADACKCMLCTDDVIWEFLRVKAHYLLPEKGS